MQAGSLRHRITIQELNLSETTTRDDHGGIVEDWRDVVTVWASVEPIRAVEIYRANQVDARITHRITTRYQAGITTAMRALFGTRTLLFLSVINPDERRIMLEMLAMEAA
jgi:SPP1 family predicted phage head-tail adaptor